MNPSRDVTIATGRAGAHAAPSGQTALELNLWNIVEIQNGGPKHSTFGEVLEWIVGFVNKPNRELGRPGAVCPFVMPTLELRCLWIAVQERETATEGEMCAILSDYIKYYERHRSTAGKQGGLATYVIAFPNFREDCIGMFIDRVHSAMKPAVVKMGLMLGEFYPGNMTPGVHNPNFYSLRSPVPLFVLREMVPADLAFLNKATDPPEKRVQFLRTYLKSLAGELSAERLAQAHDALAAAEGQLGNSRCSYIASSTS